MHRTSLLCAVLSMFVISSLPSQAQNLENTEFGQFVKIQMDMIALPPSWQPNIAPGSFVFISWDKRTFVGLPAGYRLLGKYIEGPPSDFPQEIKSLMTPKEGTTIGYQKLKSQRVDLSVVVGKFIPAVGLEKGTRINYPATKFYETSMGGNGANQVNDAIAASATLLRHLTNGSYDVQNINDHRIFRPWGQGYVVTTVASVEKLAFDVVSTTDFSAALKTLDVSKCTDEVPASQLKAPGSDAPKDQDNKTPQVQAPGGVVASPGQSATPGQAATTSKPITTKKGTLDAASDAVTKIDTTSFTDAKVKVCRVGETRYDLDFSPAVPIAFQAVEIRYTGPQGTPRACTDCDIQDLRDGMVLGK